MCRVDNCANSARGARSRAAQKKEPFGSMRWKRTLWRSTLYPIGTAGLFFSRPTQGLKLGLAIGGSLPPFLVLPRRSIRGVAGFPAWRACRFSALSASIYIPRQQAAACPTPEDGALGFAYTRWSFWVIAHFLALTRDKSTSLGLVSLPLGDYTIPYS